MTCTPDQLIAGTAIRQEGAFHRDQALTAGFTARQMRCRTTAGRWLHPARNVYMLAGVAPSPVQRLWVAVLASGGAASHRSSAASQEMISWHPAKPDVTISPNRSFRSSAMTVHRQADVVEENITLVAGLRCTDPYETLLSLGTTVSQALLERALDRALHRGLVEYDDLVSYYFRKAKQGRNGCGKLHELFCIRDPEMPPAESDLETLLWRLLRGSGLPMPERQVPLRLGERGVRFDLAYPGLMVCLEGDGFGTHTIRGRFETDRSRHNAVVLAGWLPVHFTWRMIVHDQRYVIETTRQALQNRGFLGA